MYTGVLEAILSKCSLGYSMGTARQAQAVLNLQRIRYYKIALPNILWQQALPSLLHQILACAVERLQFINQLRNAGPCQSSGQPTFRHKSC